MNSCGWVYLNEFFYDTYPIGVFRDKHEVIEDLVEDKLALRLVGEGTEDLLDNMCPLEVLRQLNDMTLERLGDQVLLCRAIDKVEHELDRMRALLVATDLYEVVLNNS